MFRWPTYKLGTHITHMTFKMGQGHQDWLGKAQLRSLPGTDLSETSDSSHKISMLIITHLHDPPLPPNSTSGVPYRAEPSWLVPCWAVPCWAVPCQAEPCRVASCQTVPCWLVPCQPARGSGSRAAALAVTGCWPGVEVALTSAC